MRLNIDSCSNTIDARSCLRTHVFHLYTCIHALYTRIIYTHIHKHTGTEYKQLLADNVGLENLPSNYCGTLPALTSEVHPYAEGLTVLNGAAPSAIAVQEAVPVLEDMDVTVEVRICCCMFLVYLLRS